MLCFDIHCKISLPKISWYSDIFKFFCLVYVGKLLHSLQIFREWHLHHLQFFFVACLQCDMHLIPLFYFQTALQLLKLQCSEVQYIAKQYNTIQCTAVQRNEVQYRELQCGAEKLSTVQCGEIRYSAIQRNERAV